MIRKTAVAVLVATAALCFAVPAAAETFTSSDGILSIDLPNENWKQIEDPAKWITLSDGGNVITIDHFSNGEKLPDISVADEHYVNVYQAVFSTQNEVFIITGSVVDAAIIPEIASSIISAKVLKYDTKQAVGKENTINISEFSVVPVDKTMYVTAEWLNVRRGCSVDDLVIGGLTNGTAVTVLGSVQRNGADLGWYQVAYENGTGYVSSEFLSDTAPASKEETGSDSSASSTSSDTTYSGAVKTVYNEYGEAYTLYEGTDGYWRDKSGTAYTVRSDTEFQVWEGNQILTTYYPYQESQDNYDYSDQEGEGNLQYCYYCGQWYEQGNVFRNHICPARDAAIANGTYYGNDNDDNYDYSDQEGEGNLVYCEYCGQWYEDGNVFRNHVCPARDAALAGN